MMTMPARPISRLPSSECILLSIRRICAALLALLVVAGGAAADELRLAPGDILHIMVVGSPQLNLDAPIETDGSVWFPLVGPIAAAGETLRAVRDSTAEAYASMSLSQPISPEGGLPQIIEKNQVYVTVAAYRPIYVAGDIPNPREIPFRQGLTLRHAIALANEVAEVRRAPPTAEELQSAATALAHEYAKVWRLKTLLGTAETADYDRIFVPGASGVDDLVAIERSILDETRGAIEAQKQRLRNESTRIGARIAVLVRQKDNESAGLELDEQDLAKVREAYDRGAVTAARLADVRRATLVTSSRALDIDVALETARGQASKTESDILQTDTDARISALTDLGQAVAGVQQRRADLAALGASAGLAARASGQTLTVSVIRDGTALTGSDAPLSLALMPGDIIEFHFEVSAPATKSDVTGVN